MKHNIYVLLCVYALHLFSSEEPLLDLSRDIQIPTEKKTLQNMSYCLGLGYPNPNKNLFYANIVLQLNNGNLFLTNHKREDVKVLFSAEPVSNTFRYNIPSEMFDTTYKNKVIKAHISPNGKFVSFLVGFCNDFIHDCKPVSIYVVDIAKNTQEIFILNEEIKSFTDHWKKNRVSIEKNDEDARKRLEKEGYCWSGGWHSSDRDGIYMDNDIISLAVDNNGHKVAVADQTGIMIIDMKKKTIQKVVSENWSLFSSLSTIKEKFLINMCFDDFGRKLFYDFDHITDTINNPELQQFDHNTNNLKTCKSIMGILSPDGSPLNHDVVSLKKKKGPAFWKDRSYQHRDDML